jgi:hypothetical protein
MQEAGASAMVTSIKAATDLMAEWLPENATRPAACAVAETDIPPAREDRLAAARG